MLKECQQCHEAFESKRRDAKFCSQACQKALSRTLYRTKDRDEIISYKELNNTIEITNELPIKNKSIDITYDKSRWVFCEKHHGWKKNCGCK